MESGNLELEFEEHSEFSLKFRKFIEFLDKLRFNSPSALFRLNLCNAGYENPRDIKTGAVFQH